ncbi:MAG: glycoside hydrolase family 9 protein, partial [Mucilaginibacter polytrichastri]|nr:glycoside hydrolase family 9 protein [Mucilaginibacter polytrichastri]
MRKIGLLILYLFFSQGIFAQQKMWLRVNLAGYTPQVPKVAVLICKGKPSAASWELISIATGKTVVKEALPANGGAFGTFDHVYRLRFSSWKMPGRYYVRCGNVRSVEFRIGADVYKGSADFALQYLRQQRSGFNPYLNDSCHTHDGFTLYGPMPDGTKIDVSGGWHDASDYLQYATTSANATYHLLAAYRDFKTVFADTVLANGRPGNNGIADVLDEARWGIDWLMKMHPRPDWLFNQLADDRDHQGMRLPTRDS